VGKKKTPATREKEEPRRRHGLQVASEPATERARGGTKEKWKSGEPKRGGKGKRKERRRAAGSARQGCKESHGASNEKRRKNEKEEGQER